MVTVQNDWVLAMTGYQPNMKFLKDVGIALSDDAVLCPTVNEDTQETNVQGVYLAGVICGGMNTHRLFIENIRVHAVKIVSNIVEQMARAIIRLCFGFLACFNRTEKFGPQNLKHWCYTYIIVRRYF